MNNSFEKIPTHIFDDQVHASTIIAQKIADVIRERQSENKICVLGLATGSSPKNVYKELVRMHREEGLSFANVVTFNLDEYYPISKTAPQSYDNFMHQNLFNHIDIKPENINIPNGETPKEEVKEHCRAYEEKIDSYGGIDLQILGIGNNGHIGFNEPGSALQSKTRLIILDNSTRIANSYEFRNISEVPRLAITMGISTIFKAKKIILMAWGEKKGKAIQQSVEAEPSENVPASLLQYHDNVEFYIDEAAAQQLTQIRAPWLTGDADWTPQLIKKAVVEMALKHKKTILSLTDNDYIENGLGDLLVEKGEAYEINLQVYYMLRDSITGWPGGKPNVVLPNHPERSTPYPKTSLIFSPHPDDDIISMGGTFQRLHDQGHHVHVAYQTSGNIAVGDDFLTRFLDFAVSFDHLMKRDDAVSESLYEEAREFLENKNPHDPDLPVLRAVKGLIRRTEASATCRYVGIPEENIHFQNLPFYESGKITKNDISDADIQQTVDLLREIQPHQVFAAGDFTDPHGTHIKCFNIVYEALKRIKYEDDAWVADCWLWLYKGAWDEWPIHEIQMAIPMSPDQVKMKRNGIFIHQSQKDSVPFQGTDAREFWQRAEERNAHTAQLFGDLGMTKYAAMEAFVRYHY